MMRVAIHEITKTSTTIRHSEDGVVSLNVWAKLCTRVLDEDRTVSMAGIGKRTY
jgi:hypothetical protein